MEDNSKSVVDTDLAKAQSATGIMEGAEETSEEPNAEEKPETKKETPKASEEDDEEVEQEETEEDSDEGKEDETEDSTSAKPPTKNRSPLKAAFTQINELRSNQASMTKAMTDLTAAIKDLRTASTQGEKNEAKAEAKASVEQLIEKAKASGADGDWLKDFAKTLRDEVKAEFENELKPLKEELANTKQQTTELTQEQRQTQRVKQEQGAFLGEWQSFLPEIARSYPNATPEMIADARSEMRKLATSKQYGGESVDGSENKGKQPMPLDYILFKERQKFDTLLKVKSGKSGETGGKELPTDDEGEEDIDLNPETMNPAKLKRYEAKKYASSEPERVQIMHR